LALAVLALLTTRTAAAAPPVVKAIFFYMPTCDHCHKVIEETLPPIMEHFGDQLLITFVDVSTADGKELFYAAADRYAIPVEAQGVPLMVVGSEVMNGDVEIPSRLAAVVEEGLAGGGVDWPDLPGVEAIAAREGLAAPPAAPAPAASESGSLPTPAAAGTEPTTAAAEPTTAAAEPTDAAGVVSALPDLTPPSVRDQWAADPVGFGIALGVLAFMLASVILIGRGWWRSGLASGPPRGWQVWVVPVLCVIGIVVASYLAYVESTSSKAVCGPVGDCNAVQESDYALLFGMLPVGVLGVAGYLVIAALWAWQRYGRARLTPRWRWVLPLVLMFGVVFSLYLTLLELFVILAVCMWCVTSAVTMTLLLWAQYKGWAEPDAT